MGTQYFHGGDSDGVPVATEDLLHGLELCRLLTKHIDADHP